MDNDRVEYIIQNAVSFPGVLAPVGAKELFRRTTPGRTYIYYGDGQGKYYYETVEGLEFKKRMVEVERKQRIQKWECIRGSRPEVAPVQQYESG